MRRRKSERRWMGWMKMDRATMSRQLVLVFSFVLCFLVPLVNRLCLVIVHFIMRGFLRGQV